MSVSVEALEMLCAEKAEALAPWALDLKPHDLLSFLILQLQQAKFILNQICLSVISFGACSDFDCVRLL